LLLANTSSSGIKSVVIEHNETMDTVATLKQSERRWIEVDLSKQRLIAWTGRKPSYAVIVSTGKLSTTTHRGFAIQSRHRFARMQGSDYNIPDVPTQCTTPATMLFTEPTITALVLQLAMVASM